MDCAYITGATGMIGRYLADELAKDGIEVVLFVRPGSTRLNGLERKRGITIIPCDLSRLSEIAKDTSPESTFPTSSDSAFFHLGWESTHGASRNDSCEQARNIDHTLAAIELARSLGCSVFVGAGSQAEYGRVEGVLSPETPAFPENAYGVAKLAAGQLSRIYASQFGIRHIWARILSIYGPHDGSHTAISSTIQSLLAGKEPHLTEGKQVWDYLYVEDAAHALRLMAEKGRDGSVYCVGSGRGRPLRSYMEQLRDEIDPCLPLGFGEIPYGQQQVMHLVADISSLYADTGFEPRISFSQGIRQTIDWTRDAMAAQRGEGSGV